jgi:hypothetical protein
MQMIVGERKLEHCAHLVSGVKPLACSPIGQKTATSTVTHVNIESGHGE